MRPRAPSCGGADEATAMGELQARTREGGPLCFFPTTAASVSAPFGFLCRFYADLRLIWAARGGQISADVCFGNLKLRSSLNPILTTNTPRKGAEQFSLGVSYATSLSNKPTNFLSLLSLRFSHLKQPAIRWMPEPSADSNAPSASTADVPWRLPLYI